MPLTIFRGPQEVPLDPLIGPTVAVLGYGNQGRAHALNLGDSGVNVVVGNREGTANARRCLADGFERFEIAEAAGRGDLVIMALPDEAQTSIWTDVIAPHIRPGSVIGFLTGFALRFGFVEPGKPFGVVMVAPKGPGTTLRSRFLDGQGIPCLFAVHQPSPKLDARAIGLAWAAGIGAGRAGVIETTVADEAETDLFGEQAVLCGGMNALIITAFETLISAGYPAELAYLECCHEVKQVADLVYERGLAGMMEAISNTAEFGAHDIGPALIDETARERMRQVLEAVRDGSFAERFHQDHAKGFEWFEAQRAALRGHPIEPAGEIIRGLMPWLGDKPGDDS